MPLLIPYDLGGLDAKTRFALDDIIARIQAWAARVDGINAAERLSELSTGIASLPTVQTGVSVVWWKSTLPTGYLWCDGAAHSRTTYANLFAVLGTTFGAGNGSTTFNVPDCRSRSVIGVTASGTASVLGETGGALNHVHSGPSHTHTGPSHTHAAGTLAGPSHTHSTPNHTHSVSGSTANESSHTHSFSGTTSVESIAGCIDTIGGASCFARNDHTHTVSGTTGAGSAHSHAAGTLAAASDGASTTGSGGTGSVTGSTAAAGTGDTGAGGTGNTGTANAPYIAGHWIIKT